MEKKKSKALFRLDDAEAFKIAVADKRDKLLSSVENSKRDLEDKGVPRCYWAYILANNEDLVPGDMLGGLFLKEKDMLDVISEWGEGAIVWHDITESGDHVSKVVDIRNEEVVMHYLFNSLDLEEYRQIVKEIVEESDKNV